MWRILVLVLGLARTPAWAQAQVELGVGTGRIDVIPVDPYGQRVSGADIVVFRKEGTVRTRMDWGPDRDLAFGLYDVSVKGSGFQTFSQKVVLKDHRTQIFACLRPVSIHESAPDLKYAKLPTPGGGAKCNYVVIFPLFCGGGTRVALSFEGSFVVEGLEAGLYVAVGVAPEHNCGMMTFEATSGGASVVRP